jgi:hypothetical protein
MAMRTVSLNLKIYLTISALWSRQRTFAEGSFRTTPYTPPMKIKITISSRKIRFGSRSLKRQTIKMFVDDEKVIEMLNLELVDAHLHPLQHFEMVVFVRCLQCALEIELKAKSVRQK